MSQQEKILDILEDYNWHCVNEFIDTYCVDYRRRLCDLKKKGYLLENRKCEQHNYHRGFSKEWRLLENAQAFILSPYLPKIEDLNRKTGNDTAQPSIPLNSSILQNSLF